MLEVIKNFSRIRAELRKRGMTFSHYQLAIKNVGNFIKNEKVNRIFAYLLHLQYDLFE